MIIDIALAASSTMDYRQAYDISDVIRVGLSLIILFSGVVAVFFIIWGGVMLILSGGKEDKVKPAMNNIRYAVIGLIVIIVAVFVSPKVGDMLGLNVSTYVSPNVIFSTIQDLSGKFFGTKDEFNLNPTNGDAVLPDDFSNL